MSLHGSYRVSTLAALGLDIYVRRKQTSRGIYKLQEIDAKKRPEATRGPFTDDGQSYAAGVHSGSKFSEVWEEPRPSMGPYSEQSDKLAQQGGYSNIDEIGAYDTGYHGGHVQRAFGQD